MLLDDFQFIRRKSILFVSGWCGIFVEQIDGVVNSTVRSESRGFEHILELVTQSSITRVDLLFPIHRLFLPINWTY